MYAIFKATLFIAFAAILVIALVVYARRKVQPTAPVEVEEEVPSSPAKQLVPPQVSPIAETSHALETEPTAMKEIPDMEICPDRNARKQEPHWSAPDSPNEAIPPELSQQATQTQERRMSDRAQLRKCLATTLDPPVLPSEATQFYFFNFPMDDTCKLKHAPKEVLMAGDNALWSDVMHLSNGDINQLASELADNA
jgi:hypothetical protein